MEKIKINLFYILYFIIFLSIETGCIEKDVFAIMNCYGGTIQIEIEFEKDQTNISPKIIDLVRDNKLSIKLDYPEKLEILESNKIDINKGFPIKKMKVTRNKESKIYENGKDIIHSMDLDVIGLVARCPSKVFDNLKTL